MRAAVVGHVEWVSFARVERVPRPGEIVHALDHFEDAAGGGGVAAVQLARLAEGCTFFTALGDDELGRRAEARLRELGVDPRVAWRAEPTRRALVHLDAAGERTITVVGERIVPAGSDPLPWEELASADAVYLTGGDPAAAAAARAAPMMVATPRAHDALAGVVPDVLVWSGGDADETRWAEGLHAHAKVRTAGVAGGAWTAAQDEARTPNADPGRSRTGEGRAVRSWAGFGGSVPDAGVWAAAELPGPVVDAYGCGDSFAAGLTFALGSGEPLPAAVEFGARCGAVCLTGRGPYGARL